MLVAGGIDLSVGATYSLAGVTSAHFAHPLERRASRSLLGIGAGLLIGLANGLVDHGVRGSTR